MGDPFWTGEQDRTGRDTGDNGDPVRTGGDKENPVGTQQVRGDKGGPIVPGERGWAQGTSWGSPVWPGPGGYLVPGERGGEAVAVQVAAGAQVGQADLLPAAHRPAPLAHGRRAAPHPPVAVPVIRR